MDGSYFSDTAGDFWSFTESADNSANVWYLKSIDGSVTTYPKTGSGYSNVRCVRGGSQSDLWMSDYTVIDTNTVLHNTTGLTWQRNPVSNMSWQDALNYCEGSTVSGQIDWRLPNIRELQTIVDYSKNNPAIDTGIIVAGSVTYWSSTSYTCSASNALGVWFSSGDIGYYSKSTSYSFRCVRGGQ